MPYVRVQLAELKWLVEEDLCYDRKKLALVMQTVRIEKSFDTFVKGLPHVFAFATANLHPTDVLLPASETRNAIFGTIEHVQLMGRFVLNDIVSQFRVYVHQPGPPYPNKADSFRIRAVFTVTYRRLRKPL